VQMATGPSGAEARDGSPVGTCAGGRAGRNCTWHLLDCYVIYKLYLFLINMVSAVLVGTYHPS
jgi:hypothetical protein